MGARSILKQVMESGIELSEEDFHKLLVKAYEETPNLQQAWGCPKCNYVYHSEIRVIDVLISHICDGGIERQIPLKLNWERKF